MAYADISEERRDQRRRRQPDQDVKLHGMDAEITHYEGDRVGAEAEVGGVAEREHAGIAEQEIESERRDGHDQAIGEQLCLISTDEMRQRQQDERNRDAADKLSEDGSLARQADDGGFHHALPNTPLGRTSSTKAAIR